MPKKCNDRLLIMDGSHYLYRAYYGVPESAKLPNGLQVTAVYGFMAYLRKAVKKLNPKYIVVIFDSETGIVDKVQKDPSYKFNRDYTDNGMYKQLPLIKRILELLSIHYVEPLDCEADDYIGTLATMLSNKDLCAYIFSNDADFYQLLSKKVSVVKMGKKEPEIINERVFNKMFSFESKYYLDYLSLKGDESDNIEGVPGVGKKTAQKLICKYGTIDGIMQRINDLPKTLRQKINSSSKVLEKNRAFLKIKVDVNMTDTKINVLSDKFIKKLSDSTNNLLKDSGVNIY